ncbi:MAG: hypothetical protein LBM77_09410 [Spirochaetaceae bacterium]|jgi:hypothetical protein|nr:hypothetical protein [Spirochaetaceae bacterium]
MKIRNLILLTVLTVSLLIFSGCPTEIPDAELPWKYVPGVSNKTIYERNPDDPNRPFTRAKIGLEVSGSQNPLIALEYRMDNANGPYYFDYVTIGWAKFRATFNESAKTFSFGIDLSDIQATITAAKTMISPLQSRNIKVLLGITNASDSVLSFANLPATYMQEVASLFADTLKKNGFNGFELDDSNAADGCYPYLGCTNYYDPETDYDMGGANADDGSRVSVNTDQEVLHYWQEGAYNYSAFLTFFRYSTAWGVDANVANIGAKGDYPVIIRETGFAGGTTYKGDNPLTTLPEDDYIPYMQNDISYWNNAKLYFRSVIDQIDYVLNPGGDTYANYTDAGNTGNFGWMGTGRPVSQSISNHLYYGPGVIDLGKTDTDDYYGERLGKCNMANPAASSIAERAYPQGETDRYLNRSYGLVYYKNHPGTGEPGTGSAEIAARLDKVCKWVYGSRNNDSGNSVSTNDGPAVIWAP